MRTVLSGWIEYLIPRVNGTINKDGFLVLKRVGATGRSPLEFTIDTGFTGGISLPEDILESLKTELIGYETYELATGHLVELPVFIGTCLIARAKIETRFIPGDFLIGMEFMGTISSRLIVDFDKKILRLERK